MLQGTYEKVKECRTSARTQHGTAFRPSHAANRFASHHPSPYTVPQTKPQWPERLVAQG
jgi:hypothetical protein